MAKRTARDKPKATASPTSVITKHNGARQTLPESEDRYRALFDRSLDAVYIHDLAGNFLDANDAALRLLGYSRDEILGLSFADLLGASQLPVALAVLQEIMKNGYQAKPTMFKLKRKDGTLVEVETVAAVITNEGQSVAIQGIARDITTRKQAEEALRESEAKYRAIFENVHDLFYQTNKNAIITEISPSVTRYGYTREGLIGTSVLELYEDPEERTRIVNALIEHGEIADYEIRLKASDGRVIDASINARVLRNPDGTIAGSEGALRDITERKQAEERLQKAKEELEHRVAERTAELEKRNAELRRENTERKQAEEALRESEETFRTLYTKTPAMVHSIDPDGNLLSVSDRWLEVFGYERNEVIGRKAVDFLTAESRQYAETVTLPEFWKTGRARDIAYQFVKKNGEIIDVLLSAVAERDLQGSVVRSLAVLDDITERKRLEEKLQQARDALEGRVERQMQQKNPYRLTFREFTVLHHVAAGKADKEIALELGISPLTVHKHVANILGKMSAASRTEAAARALREGLVD